MKIEVVKYPDELNVRRASSVRRGEPGCCMKDDPKQPPDAEEAALVDHIGADLWRAFRAYEKAMFERVAAKGFEDISLADSDVFVFVDSEGTPLNEIAKQRRVTKQSAHEQVHSLVKRGYLVMEQDPNDRRARIVRYTKKGNALVASLKSIKRGLHREVVEALGEKQTKKLRMMLAVVENLK